MSKEGLELKAEEVINTHPSYIRLKSQLVKGLEKYGTPVDPTHYSVLGWLEHKQMELTDELVYNEMLATKIKDLERILNIAVKQESIFFMREYLFHALEILEGHKEGNE